MEVDLLYSGERRTLTDEVVERAAIDVLEDQADVLDATQESSDVAVARDSCVDTQLCKELGCDILSI